MTDQQRAGRASIFRDKEGGARVQGVLTPRGIARFEERRVALARLVKREPTQVSDADVIESLSRGPAETREYLKEHHG